METIIDQPLSGRLSRSRLPFLSFRLVMLTKVNAQSAIEM